MRLTTRIFIILHVLLVLTAESQALASNWDCYLAELLNLITNHIDRTCETQPGIYTETSRHSLNWVIINATIQRWKMLL
jgi:hypothetical protein